MSGEVVVLGAPSAIGLVPHPDGQPRRLDLAPDALRAQGLVERVGGRDLGDAGPPPPYRDIERPVGRCRNEDDLISYMRQVAERIGQCRRDENFVLLLGGDCSILLGALLGLRAGDQPVPGVVYVDAHADFATLDESPSASACSMALALAVGRDKQPLARLSEHGPLTSSDRVAHVGRRDRGEPSYGAAALEQCGVLDLPMSAIRSQGIASVAEQGLQQATARSDRFWVHFDVDVLDPTVLSATGDPAPGGIELEQAAELLAGLLRHPAAAGMQLTLYDPTLDTGDRAASDLVTVLGQAFAARPA